MIQPFTGLPFSFLIALLRNPTQNYSKLATQIGVKPRTMYHWDFQVPGFKEAKRQIQAREGDLKTEYAKAAFLAAIPDVTDAMVSRAKAAGKDAQRAGERILESVGVLGDASLKPGKGETIDIMALRIIKRSQA